MLGAKQLTQRNGKLFGLRAISLAASFMFLAGPGSLTAAFAASEPNVNFKIYSPQDPPASGAPSSSAADAASAGGADSAAGAMAGGSAEGPKSIFEEDTPKLDTTQDKPVGALPVDAGPDTAETPAAASTSAATPAATTAATPAADAANGAENTAPAAASSGAAPAEGGDAATASATTGDAAAAPADGAKSDKVLQGYIRVVPTGTKIPIIMDTAVDSDTSQEADEFSARTSEDLTIDGSTVVPAGSVIKGRIAQLNAPKAMSRSGSVALKFDTITTPDNRQIPLVANIVAHGGVVHARRGMKDIAIDAGAVAAPVVIGGLIGVLAGKSNTSTSSSTTTTTKHVSKATGAAIGVGIGLAVGVIILCAKKGKKVEVRPGDELKIELAEDLRMPTI